MFIHHTEKTQLPGRLRRPPVVDEAGEAVV